MLVLVQSLVSGLAGDQRPEHDGDRRFVVAAPDPGASSFPQTNPPFTTGGSSEKRSPRLMSTKCMPRSFSVIAIA